MEKKVKISVLDNQNSWIHVLLVRAVVERAWGGFNLGCLIGLPIDITVSLFEFHVFTQNTPSIILNTERRLGKRWLEFEARLELDARPGAYLTSAYHYEW